LSAVLVDVAGGKFTTALAVVISKVNPTPASMATDGEVARRTVPARVALAA
jgi:hypothetical protein